MGKKIALVFSLVVSFVLLNVFARFLYSQTWFSTTSFSKELDPFDIITLVVTTAVTVWLGLYVSKKITEQRFEKEYVINDLKHIEEEINHIEKNMQSREMDIQSILDLLNKLNIYIERFSKTIEIFEITCIEVNGLNKAYKKLYKKTTNIDGSQLVLDGPIRNEINKVCSDFIIKTREMIKTVNKH